MALSLDHLGSTSETTGASFSEQLYYPYGAKRTTAQVTPTRRNTSERAAALSLGQRWEAIGLYDYKARFYDPALGRFIQSAALGTASSST